MPEDCVARVPEAHGARPMLNRIIAASLLAASTAFAPMALAQQQQPQAKQAAPAQTPLPKAGPGEKVCQHTFSDKTTRAWVCKQAEPCCAWDEIRYVKCGSPVFRCL
jgi:hypothetical protein